jgi:hypothetical protein
MLGDQLEEGSLPHAHDVAIVGIDSDYSHLRVCEDSSHSSPPSARNVRSLPSELLDVGRDLDSRVASVGVDEERETVRVRSDQHGFRLR